jgi:hypothetical protein
MAAKPKRIASKQARFMVSSDTRKKIVHLVKVTGMSETQVESFCMGYGAVVLSAGLDGVRSTVQMQESILKAILPGLKSSFESIAQDVSKKEKRS